MLEEGAHQDLAIRSVHETVNNLIDDGCASREDEIDTVGISVCLDGSFGSHHSLVLACFFVVILE